MTPFKKFGILLVLLLGISLPSFAQSCTLTVKTTPTNNGIICSGNAVILTAEPSAGTPAYSFAWSTGETTASISVNKPGTYTVTVTDQSGCPPITEPINITENTAPDAPSVAPTAKVCQGSSITLQATGPGGFYQWYNQQTGGTPLASGASYTTPPINTATTFYVETTLNGCTSIRTPVLVDLNGKPNVSGDTKCAGSQATLSASGADSYTWYDQAGNVVGTGPVFITPPLTTSTNYYVVAVTNGCGSGATPVLAVITPYPAAPNSTAPAPICTGSRANLHATANGLIDWFDVETGGTPLITSADYTTPVLTANKTYYVQSTNNGCVSLRTPVTVTVNSIPEPPTVPPTTVCLGTSATLTASSASGGTFNWYADPAGATLLATGNPFQTPAINKETTFYAQTTNGGCVSTLTPVTVSILPAPATPTATSTLACPGTSATLTATAPGGSYEWYDSAAGGTLLGSGDTFTTPPITGNTVYFVQTTGANGCVSARKAVTATVSAAPTPPTGTGGSACYGTAATLTASGTGSFQWYDSQTGGTLVFAGKVFVTPALTATTTYYVEAVVNGCSSTRTGVTASVIPPPAMPTAANSSICAGSSTTLTATVPPGGTIRWYDAAVSGNLLATGNTFTTPKIYNPTTYYVENDNGTCLSNRTVVNVATGGSVTYPQFQYDSGTHCVTGPNTIPTINDPAGGVFSATPVGLKFIDITTGEVDLKNSLPGKYVIAFVGNEACHSRTESGFNISLAPDARFSYAGPYCQYATTNPDPTFPKDASAGVFSATPAGLAFLDNTTGTIDLQKSLPGTYTVTNTIKADGDCPANSSQNTVTIVPGVSVYAGPDQIVSAGTTAQLAGTITGISSGKWTGGTGKFNDATLPNAIYTPGAGETTATLTLTSATPPGNCGAKSDQVTLTIVPKPSAPTVAGQATCIGSSVTLKATAPGGTYEWYDAATGGNLLFTGASFATPANSVNTTYYVQTTILGNASDRTAVQVTVSSPPEAPTASASPTCFNTPATLTASGSSGSYQWFSGSSGGTMLATGATYITPALTANATYYVQAINGGCAGPRVPVPVTVTKAPAVTSAAQGTTCSGSVQNYTITSDAPSATYTWARPAVAGISNPAVADHAASAITESLVNTGSSTINVTYNITATDNTCSTAFQYIVAVNPAPVLTSGIIQPACSESPVNYTISLNDPTVAFTWSRVEVPGVSNAAISGQEAPVIREVLHNTTNLPVDVIYQINYAEGECSGSLPVKVTVNPVVTMVPLTEPVCSNNPLSHKLESNVATATFSWRREAVPGISNPAVHNQTSSIINETLVNTTSAPVNTVYYITPSAYGCSGITYGYVVTVNPTPGSTTAVSNSPVCVKSSIRLQTPDVTGAGFLWTGPNGYTSTDQNPVISNATAANAGTYKVSLVFNGCPGPPASVDVQVNEPAVVKAGGDQTICITTTTINLHGTITGGTKTVFWTTSGTGVFSPSVNAPDVQYNPSDEDRAAGTITLRLSSTSKDDCSPAHDDAIITFAPTPAVGAGADQLVCTQTAAIPLNGQLLKSGTVLWSTAGTGTFSPSATQLNAFYIPSPADVQSGSVKLTLTYQNAGVCDIDTDKVTYNFLPPPTLDAGKTRYVLVGRKVMLTPTVSDENVQYSWSPDINISSTTIKNPIVTGDKDRYYTLTITDIRGCVIKDSVLVKVSPEVTTTNTFTPNGDGVNDTWQIDGLEAYVNATVDIFDRYGARVYQSIGYPRPWDGNYNGKPLPAGTYYYVIKLMADERVLSGYVAIIR